MISIKNAFMRLFVIVTILSFPVSLMFGQDVSFSQFRESPLIINPALTGYYENTIRAGLNYRDQWKSFHAPYRTASAYVDAGTRFPKKINCTPDYECLYGNRKKINIGYGCYFFSDKAGDGDLKTTCVMAVVSFGINFSRYFYAAMGVAGGFGNKSIDFNKLKFMSQWNGSSFNSSLPPDLDNVESSFSYPDFNVGVFICDSLRKKLTISAGISVHHLTQPVNGFLDQDERIPMKIILETWIDKKIRGLTMEFSCYYAFQNQFDEFLFEDDFNELIVGAAINNLLSLQGRKYPNPSQAIDLGTMKVLCALYLRLSPVRDIIPVIGLEKNNLKITFSYDISFMEKFSSYPYKGGFEFSLSTKIPIVKESRYPIQIKN